jgi:hypothetical protein
VLSFGLKWFKNGFWVLGTQGKVFSGLGGIFGLKSVQAVFFASESF